MTTPAPYRPRLSSVIGAAFVGSTLIAVMAPAHADPAGSATIAFDRPSDTVEAGTEVPPNAVSVSNTGDAAICLMSLATNATDFVPRGFEGGLVDARSSRSFGVVGGTPHRDTEVVATLTYTLADPESGCGGISFDTLRTAESAPWTVTVSDPEPSPPPSEEPTEGPTEDPTEDPTEEPSEVPTGPPSPSPTRTPSPSESDTPPTTSPPADPPSPSATATEGGSGSGAGGSGGSGNDRGASTPDRTPRSNVSSAPTSSASIPTLPRNEADLPDLSPGTSEDLADLPLVTPTSDEDTETEIAADHSDMGPSIAPAVLLAAFLLALLLATPLAPTRRVRLGSGYQGKRRRG